MPSIFREKTDPLELRLRLSGLGGWLRVWLPPLLAIFVIANESTGRFSANNTSAYLRPIVEHYFGHIRNDVWAVGHHVFRKSGHFIGFGLVCLAFCERGCCSWDAWRIFPERPGGCVLCCLRLGVRFW